MNRLKAKENACIIIGDIKLTPEETEAYMMGVEAGITMANKKMFDRFDKYACIKDDQWYKNLKKEELYDNLEGEE